MLVSPFNDPLSDSHPNLSPRLCHMNPMHCMPFHDIESRIVNRDLFHFYNFRVSGIVNSQSLRIITLPLFSAIPPFSQITLQKTTVVTLNPSAEILRTLAKKVFH